MSFDFDEVVDRRGTHSAKWDAMQALYGVSPDDGISMWVADMDFRAPPAVTRALTDYVAHGVFGYYGDDREYRGAVVDWMTARHGWEMKPEWLCTTHGLVNGVALCVQTWSRPGDGVILFTPVYHAFHKILAANQRRIVQSELKIVEGRHEMDLETLEGQLRGDERMVILCSPHNPGGRVWTEAELRALADFCVKHDLILVSDEIHADLVMPDAPAHTVVNKAAPHAIDRIVTCLAGTKTFNLAGAMTGGVIIEDADLRAQFQAVHMSVGASPNSMGVRMITAAYQGGAEWLDALRGYLDGNRRAFDAAVNAIPGVASMPLESTYLAWVDFSGTGMDQEEIRRRIEGEAKIAVNHGPTFGQGGEGWMRFNFATPRSRVEEAGERLQRAFADLQ